jgi:hypothetical protein
MLLWLKEFLKIFFDIAARLYMLYVLFLFLWSTFSYIVPIGALALAAVLAGAVGAWWFKNEVALLARLCMEKCLQ